MVKRVKLGDRAKSLHPIDMKELWGEDDILLEYNKCEYWLICPNCETEMLIESGDETVKCDCYMEFKRTSEDSFRVNPDYYFAR